MITEDMLIGEILDSHPELAFCFIEMGMHCLGCPASRGESIEEACIVHNADVGETLKKLNAALEK